MSIAGVVFDFDYTIAALKPIDFFLRPHTMLRMYKMKQICDRYRGFRSINLAQQISEAFAQEDSLDEYHLEMKKIYQSKNILLETKELITLCDTHTIPRGIISDHASIDKLFSIGMSEGWSAVINSQDYGAFKPLPDALFAMAAQIDVPISSVLVVGDRWDTDGMLAFRSGATFLHVEDIKSNLQHICFRQ